MPVTVLLAAATVFFAAALLGLFPSLDLVATRFFFDAANDTFPASKTEWGHVLRLAGMYLPHLPWIICLLLILTKVTWPQTRLRVRPSVVLFLMLTAAIVPGIIVNLGFKQHWGRPRPTHVAEFGGKTDFVPWWDKSELCARNCSFMSGETSGAALLVGGASLAPPPARPIAVAAAGLFMMLIGGLRVAFGGHWLSDVLIGGGVSVLLVVLARHILLFARGIDDAGIGLALEMLGYRLRAIRTRWRLQAQHWFRTAIAWLAARLRPLKAGLARWSARVPLPRVPLALRVYARRVPLRRA